MPAPLVLNRYRLLETTGKGSFGTVDVAWDSRLQRRVAIKRIPLAIDATDLPGIQEARTAALLNDARIVNVLDFEVTGTEALLIMEYVDGPTLGTLLRESTELLDLDLVATVVKDVAAALEYAHENQVLHLDIKPDNILIDHKGHLKVSDFGLSQLSGTVGFAEPQGGTIGYMPPEQLMQGEVDERTDLWALAILLYQLLTGRNPFFAQTTDESLARILNEPLPLPSSLRPGLGPALDEVLVTALMADKHLRFARVADFVAEAMPLLGNAQTGRRRLKRRVNERDLDEGTPSDDRPRTDGPFEGEEGAGGRRGGGGAGGGGRRGGWGGWGADSDAAEHDDLSAAASAVRAPSLWERLPSRLRGTLGRLVAALACGTFAAIGLGGFDLSATPGLPALPVLGAPADAPSVILVGVVALIALGGFLVPQLGSLLACATLAGGIAAQGSFLVAGALALALVAWWLLCGRKGHAESVVVTLAPLLGTLGMAFALPLLAGRFLPWARAVAAATAQWVVLVALAAFTGNGSIVPAGLVLSAPDGLVPTSLLAYLGQPLCWVTLASLLAAALLMSLCTSRRSGLLRLTGLLLGCAALAAPWAVAAFVLHGSPWINDTASIGACVGLSFILLLMLDVLGVPSGMTSEED
ncbi:MAG: serine/threonine protein kinase [Coriobacteriales bacterium]|jgi:hypothetical protein|nr:serine/threonine protein kinase [Coriobacteriales bacterium]